MGREVEGDENEQAKRLGCVEKLGREERGYLGTEGWPAWRSGALSLSHGESFSRADNT